MAAASTTTPRGPHTRSWRRWLQMAGPFVGLALVILFFAVVTGSPASFLSSANLRVVLAQTVIVALGAIGMTVIIVSGGIDLSVGSVIALTSVVTALALNHGQPPTVALLLGVAAGGAVGLVNGLAITLLRVVPFIATLGMLGVARGLPSTWPTSRPSTSPPPG